MKLTPIEAFERARVLYPDAVPLVRTDDGEYVTFRRPAISLGAILRQKPETVDGMKKLVIPSVVLDKVLSQAIRGGLEVSVVCLYDEDHPEDC